MLKKFQPGSYQSSAKGMSGMITVKAILDENKIIDLDIDASCESIMFGKSAAPHIKNKILELQTPEVDTVSGASRTTKAVNEAVGNILDQARILE